MAVPIHLLNNAESSDEDFNDSEISYSSEDDSMEDEPSEDETPESENTNGRETERLDRTEEAEKFWVQFPYLKNFLCTIVAEGLIPEYFAFERAKLVGDEKAKELNEKCKALSIMELELFQKKCELVASAISAMKSAN